MIVMQSGHADFDLPGDLGGQGFADIKVDFNGLVRSATAVLCGYNVRYGNPEYGSVEDHHVAELYVAVLVTEISGSSVTVDCVLIMHDDHADDPVSGAIWFCVIADVLELPADDPSVVVSGILTERD
jgi:hypothetical protein